MGRLTIWLRLRNAELKARIRGLARRWLRKVIELAIHDLDLMQSIRNVTSSAAFEAEHLKEAAALIDRIRLQRWIVRNAVLSLMRPLLKPGTVIIFDELFNHQNWQQGEYKALMEFAAEQKLRFEYFAYARNGGQVAIKVVGFAEADGATPFDRAG